MKNVVLYIKVIIIVSTVNVIIQTLNLFQIKTITSNVDHLVSTY